MKISLLIQELEKFKNTHGDIEVYTIHHENGFVGMVESLQLIEQDKWYDGMESEKGCLIKY